MPSPLAGLDELLRYVGFETMKLAPEGPRHPYDELLVTQDGAGSLVMSLSLLDQQLALLGQTEPAHLLQFLLKLPSQPPQQKQTIPALLLLLNQLQPLGTLQWSDKDGWFLRHCLLREPGALVSPLVVEIIESLFWSGEEQRQWLDAVAQRRETVQSIAQRFASYREQRG